MRNYSIIIFNVICIFSVNNVIKNEIRISDFFNSQSNVIVINNCKAAVENVNVISYLILRVNA